MFSRADIPVNRTGQSTGQLTDSAVGPFSIPVVPAPSSGPRLRSVPEREDSASADESAHNTSNPWLAPQQEVADAVDATREPERAPSSMTIAVRESGDGGRVVPVGLRSADPLLSVTPGVGIVAVDGAATSRDEEAAPRVVGGPRCAAEATDVLELLRLLQDQQRRACDVLRSTLRGGGLGSRAGLWADMAISRLESADLWGPAPVDDYVWRSRKRRYDKI